MTLVSNINRQPPAPPPPKISLLQPITTNGPQTPTLGHSPLPNLSLPPPYHQNPLPQNSPERNSSPKRTQSAVSPSARTNNKKPNDPKKQREAPLVKLEKKFPKLNMITLTSVAKRMQLLSIACKNRKPNSTNACVKRKPIGTNTMRSRSRNLKPKFINSYKMPIRIERS